MKYGYFLVEGPHDIWTIGRILRLSGFKLVRKIEQLDSFWERIVPEKFPHRGLLLQRVPVPTFFQSDTVSIAIQAAEGDSGLINTLNGTLSNIDETQLSTIALFCDADQSNGIVKFSSVMSEIQTDLEVDTIKPEFALTGPGQISNGNIKTGIYIFPNNVDTGNLEDLLLECALISYQDLYVGATDYVDSVDSSYRSNWAISSRNKAVVGCIANVLRPGKANQVSIQDNNWICESTIQRVPMVADLNQFVMNLIA